MGRPLIEFELRRLSEIEPRGDPHDPNLHWFGLSDGIWWINAGDRRLFEYSSTAVRDLGAPRYCDYQVVRLYEDLIGLLPYGLEEVPTDLIPCIALEGRVSWEEKWKKWMAGLPNENIGDADFNLIDVAGSWRGRRMLDSGYLSPSFDLRIWASQGQIHMEWDNRTKLVEGVCAWSALYGSFELPESDFASEVRSFHERFMREMGTRVEEVCCGALEDRGIRIDLAALAREQTNRSNAFGESSFTPGLGTDWDQWSPRWQN
jgi:hypothetical protein